jgi:hypothetical protein
MRRRPMRSISAKPASTIEKMGAVPGQYSPLDVALWAAALDDTAHSSVMATSPTAAILVRLLICDPPRSLRVHGGLLCLRS